MKSTQEIITCETTGERLDKFLTLACPELSRSRVQQLIEAGHVACAGRTITNCAHKVKSGEVYSLLIPEPEPLALVPLKLALDVVYEDDHLIIINKPAGLTVHPASGNTTHTLVNALLAHCGDSLSGIGGVMRPGIVHRIDKDTSGLLVVAKNDAAHQHLSAQLKTRTLKRQYQAVVWGMPKTQQGTIEGDIGRHPTHRKKMAVLKTGGKPARTHFEVLERFGVPTQASLVGCELDTGRTHQIRVHLTHIGCPLVGDPVYGNSNASKIKALEKTANEETICFLKGFARQALHAASLALYHPTSGELMQFSAALPEDMAMLLKLLKGL